MTRHWTSEEINILEESWGSLSLDAIVAKIGRSKDAVKLKALRNGLGDPIKSYDGISLNELSKTININYSIMKNWVKKYGLPVVNKRFTSEKKVRMIRYENWWKWAEQNKQMIDFSRFERGDLGPEPSWVDEKRKADQRRKFYISKPHNTPWSTSEINRLKYMVEKGTYTYPEICDNLKRSHGAIKRKLNELEIKYRPQYLDNHNPYTKDEVDYLINGIQIGLSIVEMANKLKRSEAGVRGKLERMGYKFKNKVPYLDGDLECLG